MDQDIWVEKAQERIKELENNTRFYLKDLFKGFEWGELTVGDRCSFGTNKSAVYEKEVF